MYFGRNLRYLRRKNKLSQSDIASFLKYRNFTTIQKWEDGTSFPKISNVIKLSDYFKVDLDDFLNNDLSDEETIEVPIIGEVKAGYGLYPFEENIGYEKILKKEATNDCFYLKVKGDSMIGARIFQDDLVLVSKCSDLKNNDIGLFILNDEATIKRIKFEDGNIFLIAENDDYEDVKITKDDNFRILGKVLHCKRLFV